MKLIRYTLAALVAVSFSQNTSAQIAKDLVVPITVTSSAINSVTLSWPMPAVGVTQVMVSRKALEETDWTVLATLPATATTYTDPGLGNGQAREYLVRQTGGTPAQRIGLVYAGFDLPAFTGSQGKIILVIDNTLSAPLASELARLVDDLHGDGWQVSRHDVSPGASTVASIKSLIRADYEADPNNAVTALLFGNLPVPYSGEIFPDGHGDHIGAWPTDYYYGDMNEEFWTDSEVNNTTASRPANRNVPGDGKFDQSFTPTLAEIMVSRVDFSNLNGWSVSQTELYRRYLNKNHAFRSGAYKPQNQTLVDDNFFYFGGEAFAQNGWRNGYAITGPNSVQAADFFNGTDNQSFLIGYGTGGGTYTSCAGIGTSDNFKTDSVNIVFSMLFGSYYGDWDSEDNPFMPSALASKGSILTCAWAGRPNWSFHHMALGEPIWVSTYWTWLNGFLDNPVYPTNYGADLIHVGLLGDPTLRAQAVRPPTGATAEATCTGVNLSWTASTDAGMGYYVYRSLSQDSVFQLITMLPNLGTAFTDNSPLAGTSFYQIKSVKMEVVPSGSYVNQSTGTKAAVIFNGLPMAALSVVALNCNDLATENVILTVASGNQPYSFLWSNNAVTQNLSGVGAGIYTVTVTDQLNCTATASTIIVEQLPGIDWETSILELISCNGAADGSASVTATGGTPPFNYLWSNGATTLVINNLGPGLYTVTMTDAQGCSTIGSVTISQAPALNLQLSLSTVTCAGGSDGILKATASGGTPSYAYKWSTGANTETVDGLPAGNYSVTLTDFNQCTMMDSTTVFGLPPTDANIAGSDTVCLNFPEWYSLVPTWFFNYQWDASNNGTIQQGQGMADASVLWTTPGLNTLLVYLTDFKGCLDTIALTVFADICVSTQEETSLAGVTVWPNPFREQLNVQFENGFSSHTRLRLHDAQGRLILEKTMSEPMHSWETVALPAGAYWLRIIENQKSGIWKVLKMN